MLTTVHPKLPMRDKATTRAFYIDRLGFADAGAQEYPHYLILRRDAVEIHFFAHPDLDPLQNDGQIYIRTDAIEALYADVQARGAAIHPNGALARKPWGLREFSILDPDHNLLTFGDDC